MCAGKAGASSQTLDSSQYIKSHRPDLALLENLVNKRKILIAIRALKAMGGYSTCVLLIDSRTFAVPMSRRRMYLLAVRTHLLTAPLGELVSQLKEIAKKIPNISATSAQVVGCSSTKHVFDCTFSCRHGHWREEASQAERTTR